jgi:hypothetical protein
VVKKLFRKREGERERGREGERERWREGGRERGREGESVELPRRVRRRRDPRHTYRLQ